MESPYFLGGGLETKRVKVGSLDKVSDHSQTGSLVTELKNEHRCTGNPGRVSGDDGTSCAIGLRIAYSAPLRDPIIMPYSYIIMAQIGVSVRYLTLVKIIRLIMENIRPGYLSSPGGPCPVQGVL